MFPKVWDDAVTVRGWPLHTDTPNSDHVWLTDGNSAGQYSDAVRVSWCRSTRCHFRASGRRFSCTSPRPPTTATLATTATTATSTATLVVSRGRLTTTKVASASDPMSSNTPLRQEALRPLGCRPLAQGIRLFSSHSGHQLLLHMLVQSNGANEPNKELLRSRAFNMKRSRVAF